MFRPLNGPWSTGARPLAALVLALAALLVPHGDLLAFDDDPAFDTFAAQPAASRSDRAAAIDVRERPSRPAAADAELSEIYQDALDDLAAGERQSAQRLFERLVARAPDTALAEKARRHLAELYAGSESRFEPSRSALEPARSAPDTERSAPSERPAPAFEPGGRGNNPPEWVSPDTEMHFIVDAGDRVFFSSGSSELGARARAVLAAQARWLATRPDVDITVEGHADDAPLGRAQHHSLAAARAEAVRQRLVSEGIDPARVNVAAYGRDHRVSDCEKPECTAQNRRAVTVLTVGNSRRDLAGPGAGPLRLPVADAPGPQAR